MRMRLRIVMAAVLLASGGPALAQDQAPAKPVINGSLEPLLVKVDAQGKVVSVLPAYRLHPSVAKILRATVDGMIKKPAIDKNGHPIPSQFIMNMILQVSPDANGTNSVQFTVASIKPVPGDGSWYWFRTPDNRMELASMDNRMESPTMDTAAGSFGGSALGNTRSPSPSPPSGHH